MKKHNWKVLFWIFIIALVIDIFVPDPLPLIDELLLLTATLYSSWRSL